jgi:hypothetical protein
LRSEPQPDFAVVKAKRGGYRFDLQRDRVWRHRDPRGREYTRLDEVESGTLPLPTLDSGISLAELF